MAKTPANPPLTAAERQRRRRAKLRGEVVPPSPREQRAEAVKSAMRAFKISRSTAQRRGH